MPSSAFGTHIISNKLTKLYKTRCKVFGIWCHENFCFLCLAICVLICALYTWIQTYLQWWHNDTTDTTTCSNRWFGVGEMGETSRIICQCPNPKSSSAASVNLTYLVRTYVVVRQGLSSSDMYLLCAVKGITIPFLVVIIMSSSPMFNVAKAATIQCCCHNNILRIIHYCINKETSKIENKIIWVAMGNNANVEQKN